MYTPSSCYICTLSSAHQIAENLFFILLYTINIYYLNVIVYSDKKDIMSLTFIGIM